MSQPTFSDAVKAAVAPAPRSVAPANTTTLAVKADSFNDEDGIIIVKVSVADVRDREKERAPLDVLKDATHELAMKGRPVDVDLNHDVVIGCDIVGVWIGDPMPDPNAAYVQLRPHDRAIYEDAKAGEICGMSWSGPYRLSEDT
jgi:hypothetical protein